MERPGQNSTAVLPVARHRRCLPAGWKRLEDVTVKIEKRETWAPIVRDPGHKTRLFGV